MKIDQFIFKFTFSKQVNEAIRHLNFISRKPFLSKNSYYATC